MEKPKIFLSHISKEAELAHVLKENITRDFRDSIDVFVSSDKVSIDAGQDWLKSLSSALQGATAVIVLCSRESVGKPWVNFEAGAAWLRNVPIIPVCHTGLKPDDLPLPLKILQAVEARQPDGIERLYMRLAKIMSGEKPNANYAQIADAVRKCEQNYRYGKREGEMLDRIPNPKIFCGASSQYATACEYEKDVAVIREAFPKSLIVDDGKLTVQRLCQALTEDRFDIIHLVNFVDPISGALILSEIDRKSSSETTDDLPADGFSKLVEISGTRLVVLASCDSLRLGAKLSRVANVVAAYSTLLNPEVIAWEKNFYRLLARHPLSHAHDISAATNNVAMILMMKKDVAFAPEPLTE